MGGGDIFRSKMGGDDIFRRKKGFEDIFVLISIGGPVLFLKKKMGGAKTFFEEKGDLKTFLY